jgi:hypothetical protein
MQDSESQFLANLAEVMMGQNHQKDGSLPVQRQDFPLMEHLNRQHPLIQLAALIDWEEIDRAALDAMRPRRGRPPLRPRLVAGLLYLQHTFGLSDEEVVWGWVENPYWPEHAMNLA